MPRKSMWAGRRMADKRWGWRRSQRVLSAGDDDRMIDNRSQRWRAESHAPAHDASRRLQGKQGWGGLVSIPNISQRLVRGRRRGSTRREMRGNEDWQRGLFCSNQLEDDGRKNIMQQSIRKTWVERRGTSTRAKRCKQINWDKDKNKDKEKAIL